MTGLLNLMLNNYFLHMPLLSVKYPKCVIGLIYIFQMNLKAKAQYPKEEEM